MISAMGSSSASTTQQWSGYETTKTKGVAHDGHYLLF